jgi:hypothetical protein
MYVLLLARLRIISHVRAVPRTSVQLLARPTRLCGVSRVRYTSPTSLSPPVHLCNFLCSFLYVCVASRKSAPRRPCPRRMHRSANFQVQLHTCAVAHVRVWYLADLCSVVYICGLGRASTFGALCDSVLCCAVLCCVTLCCVALRRVVLSRTVQCSPLHRVATPRVCQQLMLHERLCACVSLRLSGVMPACVRGVAMGEASRKCIVSWWCKAWAWYDACWRSRIRR